MFLSQNHDRKLETLSNVLEKIKPVLYMSSVIVLDEIQQPEVHFGDEYFYPTSGRFNRYYRLVRYRTDELPGRFANRTA